MEFIAEYAGFLARTVTVLAAIIVVLVVIVALRGRGRRGAGGHLDVQKLNDFYKDLRERVRHSVLDKASLKALRKEESKAAKQAKKHPEQKSRVYVLDFDGDIKASATEQLRHEVTAVLSMAGRTTRWCCAWKAAVAWSMATAWRPRNWRASARPACR